jgi:hypothetical protein
MDNYTLYPTPAPTPWDMYDRQMNERIHCSCEHNMAVNMAANR